MGRRKKVRNVEELVDMIVDEKGKVDGGKSASSGEKVEEVCAHD